MIGTINVDEAFRALLAGLRQRRELLPMAPGSASGNNPAALGSTELPFWPGKFFSLLLILLVSSTSLTCDAASSPDDNQAGRTPSVVVPGTVALEMEAAALGNVLSNQMRLATQAQQAATAKNSDSKAVLILSLIVAGALIFRFVAPRIGEWHHRRYDPWAPASIETDLAAEENVFSRFAESFTAGPRPSRSAGAAYNFNEDFQTAGPVKPPPDPVQEFFANAPKDLNGIRALLGKVNRTSDSTERQKILGEISTMAAAFKGTSGLPELLPAWQMACTFESLLQQLLKKPSNVTPSALHTLAGAVDLLMSLSRAGVKPALASEPPVRLLAVDDDAICRHAISFALKKVLSAPDLANDGQDGLQLASAHSYDAIFLDVEMPGMDGFELCTRIHATTANRATPVVFVTRHTDFDARAKSSLSGARDLIGKPFLTFEVALKALTLVLRRRLQTEAKDLMGVGQTVASSQNQNSTPPSGEVDDTKCAAPTAAATS